MSLDHPIPTVDLDLLFGEDDLSLDKSIETLSQACTHLGLFFIRSDKLTRGDMDEVLALSKEFFALPPSSKECVSRQADDMARGYMSKCKKSDSETDDAEESFDVYRPVTEIERSESKTGILMGKNRWPRQSNNFQEAFEKISHHLEELGHLLMSLLALTLMDTVPSLESSESSVFEKNTQNTFWNARIISRRLEKPQGSHGDSRASFPNHGCLTFLLTGQNCGNIQFRTNGKWRPVELAADLLLVTIGDTMEIWTNGLWVPPEISIMPLEGEDSRLNYSFCFGPDLNST
jgi:isopenicillin N synthase-like dioxygenase